MLPADASVEDKVEALVPRVSAFLKVPPRPVRLIIDHCEPWRSFTRQAWPPETPEVTLSSGSGLDVVAHEIAHCLVPSRSLFAAEGLAVWTGVSFGNSARHLLFDADGLLAIMRAYRGQLSDPSGLLEETVAHCDRLAPERFASLEGRLALAAAGSFFAFTVPRYPDLPAEIGDVRNRDTPIVALLSKVTGLPAGHLLRQWEDHIDGEKDAPH